MGRRAPDRGHTTGDFEHAEVSVFLGKNPWQSHGVPRARTVLKEIARDSARSMIVIDPVRTETADLADIHLQVRPGTDAWCLAGILGVIVQEDLVDHAFLQAHTTGAGTVLPHLAEVDVARCAEVCGLDESLLRAAARRIGTAGSVSTYEDLGVQQSPNSTLVSYLNKLIWLLTGNFAKAGAMQPHSWIAPLASYDTSIRRTPVTAARMPGGLVPCNVIADEILADHPARFRAMVIESANPAHSLADSAAFRAALAALDLVVVIDVALTETGRHADYVLPASSQFEKWEATFFTFEFPRNTFHLRAPVLDPLPGTLGEPEIYARLIRRLGVVPRARLSLLRGAARLGRTPFTLAFAALAAADKRILALAPYVLYETLGPTLPDGARSAAVLWALAQRIARQYPKAMRRARPHQRRRPLRRHGRGPLRHDLHAGRARRCLALRRPSRRPHPAAHPRAPRPARRPRRDHRGAHQRGVPVHPRRRATPGFTANTIFRAAGWRLRDRDGALRINPDDARRLGLDDGAPAQITTSRGSPGQSSRSTTACNPETPHCPTASASICRPRQASPSAPAWPSTTSPTGDGVTRSPALPGTSTCPPASSPSQLIPAKLRPTCFVSVPVLRGVPAAAGSPGFRGQGPRGSAR